MCFGVRCLVCSIPIDFPGGECCSAICKVRLAVPQDPSAELFCDWTEASDISRAQCNAECMKPSHSQSLVTFVANFLFPQRGQNSCNCIRKPFAFASEFLRNLLFEIWRLKFASEFWGRSACGFAFAAVSLRPRCTQVQCWAKKEGGQNLTRRPPTETSFRPLTSVRFVPPPPFIPFRLLSSSEIPRISLR